MAFRIGGNSLLRRGVVRDRPRPQSFEQQGRARARLNFEADNMISQRHASIEADPTNMVVWHRSRGSIPCTCSVGEQANDLKNRAAALNPADKSPAAQQLRQQASGWARRGGPLGDYSTDDFEGIFPPRSSNETFHLDPNLEEDFPDIESSANADPNSTDLAQLSEIVENGPFQGGGVDKCPICFGTGYTDAYKPSRAARVLGDFAATTDNTAKGGVLDTDAHPYTFKFTRGASVTWNLFVPRGFLRTIRVSVWNGLTPVTGVLPQVNIGGTWQRATLSTLDSLSPNGGQTYQFRMIPAAKDYSFTHFEILFALADYVHGFVDELNIPYDAEFVDYNTMVDMELPANLELFAAGDVISEEKHGRVWVAATITKNRLSNEKVVSLTSSMRAVGNEEVYHPMNVWRTPFVA